jgi:hypothetical protein
VFVDQKGLIKQNLLTCRKNLKEKNANKKNTQLSSSFFLKGSSNPFIE